MKYKKEYLTSIVIVLFIPIFALVEVLMEPIYESNVLNVFVCWLVLPSFIYFTYYKSDIKMTKALALAFLIDMICFALPFLLTNLDIYTDSEGMSMFGPIAIMPVPIIRLFISIVAIAAFVIQKKKEEYYKIKY